MRIDNDILGQALWLAKQGIPVFPCRQDKRPVTRHGFRDAHCDLELLAGWHWDREQYLIGVPTGPVSGFSVIDIDPRHAGDKWLRAHVARLPVTRAHRTRSGGLHLLFRVTDDSIRNSSSKIAPGVDVRGHGGYAIWWPAHGFLIIDFLPLSELPEFPLWVIPPSEQATPIRTGPVLANRYRIATLLNHLRKSREGERNDRLYWTACRFAEMEFPDGVQQLSAMDQLLNAAMATGLDGEEARRTVESAFSHIVLPGGTT
jgi:hypothetical protein